MIVRNETGRLRRRNNHNLQAKRKKVKNKMNKVVSKDGTKIAMIAR